MNANLHVPEPAYLVGQLLVAMPVMSDPRFARTVIYLCAHSEDGAMGLIVNRTLPGLSFGDLLKQLRVDHDAAKDQIRVRFGGPVEGERGFVLHTPDYVRDATLVIDEQAALTATIDILRDIAKGAGPERMLLALGYAGWGPGQLDAEMAANGWLNAPADPELLFGDDDDRKWERAIATLGFTVDMLSGEAGHA